MRVRGVVTTCISTGLTDAERFTRPIRCRDHQISGALRESVHAICIRTEEPRPWVPTPRLRGFTRSGACATPVVYVPLRVVYAPHLVHVRPRPVYHCGWPVYYNRERWRHRHREHDDDD